MPTATEPPSADRRTDLASLMLRAKESRLYPAASRADRFLCDFAALVISRDEKWTDAELVAMMVATAMMAADHHEWVGPASVKQAETACFQRKLTEGDDAGADFIRDGETLFEVLTRMGLEGRRVEPVEGFPSGLDIKGQGRVFGVAVDLGEHLDDGMRAATYAMSLFIERHGLEGAPVGRFDLPSGLLILLGQAPHQGEHDDDGRG